MINSTTSKAKLYFRGSVGVVGNIKNKLYLPIEYQKKNA